MAAPAKDRVMKPITKYTTKKKGQNKKNTRANMTIASLNMRGRYSDNGTNDKWRDINQYMKESKTNVLTVQETHLTQEDVDNIHDLYGRRLKILFSQGENPRAAGVATVINKERSMSMNLEEVEIVPGRALLVRMPWHGDLLLTILNIYAPNDRTENEAFWRELRQKFATMNIPRPDLMMGDFNVVEDAIDRLPAHQDHIGATQALHELRSLLRLEDGWRKYRGNDKAYSYLQTANNIHSRIDRIYATNEISKTANEWEIKTTPISTDHSAVSVRIADPGLPHQGHGRWQLPMFLLTDEEFQRGARKLARKLGDDINSIPKRTHLKNAQLLHREFKIQIKDLAIKRAKQAIPKMDQVISKLEAEHKTALNQPGKSEQEIMAAASPIQDQLQKLQKKRFQKAKSSTKVHFHIEGETISKYWSTLNKPNTPREPVYTLKIPHSNPPVYTTNSHKMADVGRQHHHELLVEGLHPDKDEREEAIEHVLSEVNDDAKLPDGASAELGKQVDPDIVQLALKESANNTSPGFDGIPYEFWKMLSTNPTYNLSKKSSHGQLIEDNPDPDPEIIQSLTKVYLDIENYGVHPDSAFAEGWMCPLYKKNDKREISNYRPITLLNTDYKIYTKTLAIKLAGVAHNAIHPNQAGFMPGRSIYDQVKLARMMVNYAETTESNGLIVALDQEKAYDKIAHDYLWRTLDKYNVHSKFIRTVRSLYESAETMVIVNGVTSDPFQVSRGVRQGDPLSCLLFNLAIEPLANLLRTSNLNGYQIPGSNDDLKTTLFADDTTVFLSQGDSYDELISILTLWCRASGARFNVNKTEVLPIGTKTYRESVLHTRKTTPNGTPLPANIHIARDNEPIRILGGWVGNGIDEEAVWSKNIDKIQTTFERWHQGHPTLLSRRLVVNMFAGGMTQYLTMVQGMPKVVETRLQKMINDFVWDGKKAPININTMSAPRNEGGIHLLDIHARNEAIEIMWLKRYTTLGPTRPMWALIADVLIEENIAASNHIDKEVTINTYLQSWSPMTDNRSKLPPDIRKMLNVGKKYNLNLEGLRIPEKVKKELPAWYHIGAEDNPAGFNRSQAPKCLKYKHCVRTVGDLVKMTNRLRRINPDDIHQDLDQCHCTSCCTDRNAGCRNPNKCCRAAQDLISRLKPKWRPSHRQNMDDLSLTPRRKKRNADAKNNGTDITFDPAIVQEGDLNAYFRIFTEPNALCQNPALRPIQPANIIRQQTSVYAEGGCGVDDMGNVSAGCGIWYGPDDNRNAPLKLRTDVNSNKLGELAAILWAITEEPPQNELTVITTSAYAIDGVIENSKKWELTGYVGAQHVSMFKSIIARLRSRGGVTRFRKLTQENRGAGYKGAKNLANLATTKDAYDKPNLGTHPNFNLTGAQLSALTQTLAYRKICDLKAPNYRRGTAQMLAITRHAVKERSGTFPDSHQVWDTTNHKDFSKVFRTFLWKSLHNTHKIGDYWHNIDNYSHRANCQKCGVTEGLEHVLLQCDIPGQKVIWESTRALWLKKHDTWPELANIGAITGCGLIEFKNEGGKVLPGTARAYRILISESTHLIWRLRCTRVHEGKPEEEWPKDPEIHNRWLATINARLTLDRSSTSKKYGKKATKQSLVLDTWDKIIKAGPDLPHNWLKSPGVLVGIDQMEHQDGIPDNPDDPP
jgi:exonuclease III